MSSVEWTAAQQRGVTNIPSERGPEPAPPGKQSGIEELVFDKTEFLIPGEGKPGDGCQTYYPKEFCDECGEPHFGQSRCQQRRCPNCSSEWTATRTVSAVSRLAAARYVEDHKRAVHAVASPPAGRIETIQDFHDAKREAYQLGKEKGIRGGFLIPHGWRATEDAKERYREAETDAGFWKWATDETDTHWRSLVEWSPHFHLIGLARDVEAGDSEADDGWVFRNIRSLDRFRGLADREGYEDMIRVTRYLLSHATFQKDARKQCIRWFGSLAPAAFSPENDVSDGAWAKIERTVEELVGASDDRGEEAEAEPETCRREGCEGYLTPIWEAGAFLDQRRDEIEPEQERRLSVAFEWAIGERKPPPGLKHPRTESEAREAFEAILSE